MTVLFSALIWSVITPAQGASFDCQKATTATELLICSDPELSKLDEELGKAYHAIRNTLGPTAKDEIRDTQRMWLKYWPSACSLGGQAPLDVNCAKEKYRGRISELTTQPGFFNNAELYPLTRHRTFAAQSPFDENEVVMVDHTLQYPQLNTANAEGDELRLIQRINAWVQPEEKVWTDSAEDNVCELQLSFHLTPIAPKLLQLTASSYGMCLGAAHGGGATFAEHFWLNKERKLNADDVFQASEWPSQLAEMVYQILIQQMGEDFYLNSADDLIALVEPTERWRIGPKGITFEFNSYDVGPYAVGPQSAFLSWRILEPLLHPGFRQDLQ